MKFRMIFSVLVMCTSVSFATYTYLQTKYPGEGLQVIENVFKETISFEKAIEALKEGHRIRRKPERSGYTKVIITEGKNQREKFGTYWVGNDGKILDHCSFSIDDVNASDWIIDD